MRFDQAVDLGFGSFFGDGDQDAVGETRVESAEVDARVIAAATQLFEDDRQRACVNEPRIP